ncbi:DHA2 family efflux MFS transporter permease subunit [Candidatus Magnetominusculus dajiuhuensis]|uniref:DHA2 family efflux MFS transporter permease subunit n=1 Tax=Candidatus Magnetominusculus dajiuhuensis TaxID=3137712 RepID=UPI003B43BED4
MDTGQSNTAAAANKWIVAVSVMLPTLIEIIDTSVVNVSLDHIRGSLSASIDEATWTVTAYLVSNAIIIPLTGWLSRMLGRKFYLILSIVIFTVSSFLCGCAWSLQSLIFFRIVQGIGGGALQPLSQAILLEAFPLKQRGTAMALFGVGILFGPIIGPLMGGWITDNWSWQWIFYINIPIGIISVLMCMIFISDPSYLKKQKMRIDYMGLALLTLGLATLQIVLDKGQQEDWFASGFIFWLSLISVCSLLLFVVVEWFAKDPIVHLSTFKNRSFTTGSMIAFFVFFNLFGSIVLLPILLQTQLGYTATLAGQVLGLGGIATLITMPIVGVLMTKVNPKWLIAVGTVIAAYSTFRLSQFNLYVDYINVFLPRVFLGVGTGLLFVPLTTLTMSGIKREEMGNATAIYNLLRNIGASIGVAFVTTMISRHAQVHQFQLTEHLSPFDRNYQMASSAVARVFGYNGFSPDVSKFAADSLIYGNTIKQASMLAFNDTSFIIFVILLSTLPLVLLIKGGKGGATPQGVH